ncbi:MAG: hypothetical protein GC201_05985 [Alphaproteobacteria bacterium]|nr:hypothetical protein [Alphaproteobacteria bacterium]
MKALELRDALVYPAGDDEPDLYYYAPKAPGIAADANGRRQFNLLTAGSVSFLQITGSWGLNPDKVAEARRELARKLGREPDALDLRPVPETVGAVSLVLAGDDGDTVLQQTKSSGMPPYHAAFNVMLDDARLKTVKAALGGERGVLGLRYDVTRRVPVTTTTAEHAAASDAGEGAGDGRAWSTATAQAASSVTRQTTEDIETLSVRLDAADWESVA